MRTDERPGNRNDGWDYSSSFQGVPPSLQLIGGKTQPRKDSPWAVGATLVRVMYSTVRSTVNMLGERPGARRGGGKKEEEEKDGVWGIRR